MMKRILRCLVFGVGWVAAGEASPAAFSEALIASRSGEVVMRESRHSGTELERTYLRDGTVLYRSTATLQPDGLAVDVKEGHESQLGSYRLEGRALEVRDPTGEVLWTEPLDRPLCPPELGVEFVRAYQAELVPGASPVRCVIPILKARKVAPVKWVRLPDDERGRQVYELRPGSLGMRLFLRPTRFLFDTDGSHWLNQDGQFETTRDPTRRPRYLKGEAALVEPRAVPRVSRKHFGGGGGGP